MKLNLIGIPPAIANLLQAWSNKNIGRDNLDKNVIESLIYPGFIWYFPRSTPPAGWIECNGALLLRADYPDLWTEANLSGNIVADASWSPNKIGGYSYGNGSTTFRIPDLRGRGIIGAGQGSGLTTRALGANGGEENHHLIISELPAHYFLTGGDKGPWGVEGSYNNMEGGVAYTAPASRTNTIGSDVPHNNMQPWVALLACIKT